MKKIDEMDFMKVKISSFVGHKIKEYHDSRPKICVEHQRQKDIFMFILSTMCVHVCAWQHACIVVSFFF
jgi:hypothetical protein